MGRLTRLVPSCADGNEYRNAWWHLGFVILSLGSVVFHLASFGHHLNEAKRQR